MVLNRHVIALQKNFICPETEFSVDNRKHASTVQAHMMQYGYMLDEKAFDALSHADTSEIAEFNNTVISYLKEVLGGKHNFQSLYKNFPNDVMSMTDTEKFHNQLLHYWTNGSWEPKKVEMDVPVKYETITYKVITVGTQKDFDNIFTRLVSINTSLMPQDMAIVKWFVGTKQNLVMPDTIPFKENLCTLAAMGLDVPIKTPTDVLRIAVHLSGGDISLPALPAKLIKANRWSSSKSKNPEREKFKFKKFKRPERRYLLGLLEKVAYAKEMKLKDGRWIRLGEVLHPGEYKAKFPKAFEAFRKIRNDKVKSWYGDLDAAFDTSFETGLVKLSDRPGEFFRRMDVLIRKNVKGMLTETRLKLIFKYFQEVAKRVSNKVLFEVYEHFQDRDKTVTNRAIFIKGARKKTPLPTLVALPQQIIDDIQMIIFAVLREKFAQKEPLGDCWVDPELKKIPLPKGMRTMNFSTAPTVRGARIPFGNPDAKVIRPFVHWMGPTDLDLSMSFMGKGVRSVLNYSNQSLPGGYGYSYSNTRSVNVNSTYAIHSGDVRGRRGPCAEYIDIDIAKAYAAGNRYVMVDVRNFNGGAMEKEEAIFGFQEREFPEANPAWLPESISSAHSLKSTGSNIMIAILDLEQREYIMVDMDQAGLPIATAGFEETVKLIQDLTQPPKVSVYDLLMMHVEGRGRSVPLESQPAKMFQFKDFATSYETTAEYML